MYLSENSFAPFHKPSNYKIVYLRRFGSAVMAMKKISLVERRLSRYASEAKKAVLENLGKMCCLNCRGPVQGNRAGI
jgi:hypothetical protein